MLTYNLHKRGKKPLYEYLYSCIREDILRGDLKPKEKLPSKRRLAENLNVSLITVQNAYEQLILEGYVSSEEKKGYFVADIAGLLPAETPVSPATETTGKNPEKAATIDLSASRLSYDHFPFSVWARITRQTLLEAEHLFTEAPQPQGLWELRRAIADHLREFRGLNVKADNIIVGAGMEYLYGMIARLLGGSGMIAVEDPGHTKVTLVYESCGIRVLHIPVDREGFRIDALNTDRVSAIHISPSHQFPTGVVMPASRRHKILRRAAEMDAIIIEDDYDSEFRFVGKPIPTLAALDNERVIYMNTFSKSLSPSVRIAYMVLPERLMGLYAKKLGFYSCTVSGLEQYDLASFIRGGYYGRHLSRMRNHYRIYRDQILSSIRASGLMQYANIREEDAGLHFLLKFHGRMDDALFQKALAGEGIRITSVSDYCFQPREEFAHEFLISYSDIRLEDLQKALSVMEHLLGSERF